MSYSATLTRVDQLLDTVRVVYEIRGSHQEQIGTDSEGQPIMGLLVRERFRDFLRPPETTLTEFLANATKAVLAQAKAEVDAANLIFTNVSAIRTALVGGHYP